MISKITLGLLVAVVVSIAGMYAGGVFNSDDSAPCSKNSCAVSQPSSCCSEMATDAMKCHGETDADQTTVNEALGACGGSGLMTAPVSKTKKSCCEKGKCCAEE
ncbi:MAG: hypothetical protein ACRC8S_10665 [Fimbriiglobus sp.]